MFLFASILFHVDSFDTNLFHPARDGDHNITIFANWSGLLGNLESLRKIGVEIIFTIEIERMIDFHMQGISNTNRIDDCLLIYHRHGSWISHI